MDAILGVILCITHVVFLVVVLKITDAKKVNRGVNSEMVKRDEENG